MTEDVEAPSQETVYTVTGNDAGEVTASAEGYPLDLELGLAHPLAFADRG